MIGKYTRRFLVFVSWKIKREILGKAVEMCLLDWGIDKILTITVDNAAYNSGLISFI